MSRTIRRFVALSIGWALLMAVAGCCVPVYEEPWAPAGHRGMYEYNYYPDSGVYYDRGRHVYFYHDQGNWKESPSLPPHVHVDSNHYKELRMDSDKPYTYHSDVNKQYPPGHHP